MRYLNSGYYGNAYASAAFAVVSTYSVPQGGAQPIPSSGTDAPAVGSVGSWDVLLNGATVATSTQQAGWQVSGSGGSSPLTVQAPLHAAAGGGYEVRSYGYYGGQSAFFSVGGSRFTSATGPANYKYIIMPNGARIQFTAPSVPTANVPRVSCSVQAGVPMLVEWNYDAASPVGHYTITMSDRTRWVTSTPSQEVASPGSGYDLLYSPSQVVDRNGNALTLTYGYLNPYVSSFMSL